nr:hypothetical protein [Tanacetum cinerariifolium]
MSLPDRKKFRFAHATGRKGFTDRKTGIWLKQISRKIRIPIDLYPCRVEEKLTIKEVDGEPIMKLETKMIAKDGTISKFPGKFPGYTPSKEEEEPKKKGSKEAPEKGPNYEFLNYAVSDGDLDLESTSRSGHKCNELEDTLTNNVNNANANGGDGNGNGGNNGCSYKGFMACNPKEYDGKGGANHAAYTDRFHELAKLVPQLVTPESSRIKRAGILTDKAVSCGTLTKGNEKRKRVEETSKPGRSWKDNKKEKVRTCFMATDPPRNEFVGPYPKCAKCCSYHPKNRPCRLCYNCQKPGQFAKDCRAPFNLDHLHNTCAKMHQAPGQTRNLLALEATITSETMGIKLEEGPSIFISTNFAPLLNVKPSIVNPRYVIEVADDLIPLGHGSLDVIVGMDWLSKNKVVIICHKKVVEIPLEGGGILRVQGKRTLGVAKALMNAKVGEPKLSDIPVVRDFVDVFPEDLLGLPPQRKVEFRIITPRFFGSLTSSINSQCTFCILRVYFKS